MLKKIVTICCSIGVILTVCFLSFYYSVAYLLQESSIQKLLENDDVAFLLSSQTEVMVLSSLEQTGLPREYTSEILEQPELKTYIFQYLSSCLLKKEPKALEKSTMTKLLQQSFSNLLKETEISSTSWNLSSEEKNSILSHFDEVSPVVIKAVESLSHDFHQNLLTSQIEDAITLWNQYEKIDLILWCSLAILILAILFLNLQFSFFILGFSLLGSSILLFLVNFPSLFQKMIELPSILFENDLLLRYQNQIFHFGRITMITSCCLILIFFVMRFIRKNDGTKRI